jgi:hypothetical protein
MGLILQNKKNSSKKIFFEYLLNGIDSPEQKKKSSKKTFFKYLLNGIDSPDQKKFSKHLLKWDSPEKTNSEKNSPSIF